MGHIKKLNFLEKNDKKIVLSLGFFDAVHKGHHEIIKKTIELSKQLNAKSTIFTFKNIESEILIKRKKELFTFNKRIQIYEELGIDYVIYANATKEFCLLEPNEFFNILTSNFNILALVVGKDYKFGHLGKGNINTLQKLADEKNIKLYTIDLLKLKNHREKISSSYIKQKLKAGDIEEVNKCLINKYSIESEVVKGKQLGKKIGFPTANFELDINNLHLKNGVYISKTKINDKIYNSITNVGNHPTTDNLKANIETHILNFNEDIYGKIIKVTFLKRIREVKKFNSLEELINRIIRDIDISKEYFKNETI